MKIDIVIPTRNRKENLAKCLRSIRDVIMASPSYSINVEIFFSSQKEREEFENYYGRSEFIKTRLYAGTFRTSSFWNSYLRGMSADALLYLSDDTYLDDNIVNNSAPKLKEMNLDGVVGIKIKNATDGQPAKAAYGLIGVAFIERFPDRQVFCPDYGAFFCDIELEEFSTSLGRFYFCEEASLDHSHPSFTHCEPDETHILHRQNHAVNDNAIRSTRQKLGLIWGQSFELITRGA